VHGVPHCRRRLLSELFWQVVDVHRLLIRCDVSVTFGPWAASPDVYDLIDCIKHDLTEKGYELEHRCIGVCDKRVAEQHFCKRSIFEFKFKWW